MSTFTQAFEALTEVQASKSENTRTQLKSVLKHLVWFEHNCNDLTDFVANYEGYWSKYKAAQYAKLKDNGEKRKLGHDRRYLTQVLKRAEKRGWITKSFKKSDFDLFESTQSPGKHVDDESVNKILFTLEGSPKGKLQVLMAVTMGMRKREIMHLSKVEILWDKKAIRLNPNRLKTRQARKVDIPITPEVEPLLRYFYDQAQGAYIFPKVDTRTHGPRNPIIIWDQPQSCNNHVWNMARKLSGVSCRFHDLRHTAASNLVSAGFSTIHITQTLGMSETMLKNIYAHQSVDDQEKMRNAFNGRFNAQKEVTWKTAFAASPNLKIITPLLYSMILSPVVKRGFAKMKRRVFETVVS